MFLDYSELLNALDSGASAKITIYNRRINKAEFERSVLLPDKDDGLNEYRHEFNQMLTAQVTGTSNSIVRERYLTVSVVKRNPDEARSYFARVGTDLVTHLAQLSSVANELTLTERLHIFRDFFKAGEQAAAEFNIHEHAKRGQHFKDWFCPDSMQTRTRQVQLAIQKAASSTRKTAVAVRSAIRHFLVGLHSLVAAIAAGISVALSIIIVISLVAFVSGSAYGIFFAANAPSSNTITVQQAVEMLTAEYRGRLEEISDTVQHDRQDIKANDDVYYIRWQDVLAVFSSYVSGNEQGAPVAALTEDQVDKLRKTMWAMNEVDYSTHPETVTIDTTDENGNPTTTEITETVLVISLTHKTPDEMAANYHFTTRQNNYLQLLQDPQYEELWAELLGGFAQGGGELMTPDSTRTPTGTLQWPLPVAGTITSQFGHRVDPITGEGSSHTGNDIACAEGTPILAAADGVVTVANGLDSWGGSYGYYIQIDHGSGLETLYAHCSSICVTTGQQVQAGQVIGYVGHTGRATGSHLHLEVHVNGSRTDAMRYFGM